MNLRTYVENACTSSYLGEALINAGESNFRVLADSEEMYYQTESLEIEPDFDLLMLLSTCKSGNGPLTLKAFQTEAKDGSSRVGGEIHPLA